MKLNILVFCLLPLLTCSQTKLNSEEIFPGNREGFFAYSPTLKTLLLIGGNTSETDGSTVWKWNGKSWQSIEASGPNSRDFFTGAFYPKTGTIICFGGQDSSAGTFWSFDGVQWKKTFIEGIESRDHHQMVYADHLNAFVLYGGANENGVLDTITWIIKDGKAKALTIPGPGVRYHFGMVYDKYRKKVVLYGGGERPDELWEFDGKNWKKIVTSTNPGKKFYHRMVYDESVNLVILHGGWQNQNPSDPINSLPPATWAWNGKIWRKIAQESLFPLAMGYDGERKQVVAFGRDENTRNANLCMWTLSESKWIKIADYGRPKATR